VKVAFRVRERASEVVETLREVLGARVRLLDAAFSCVHTHVRKNEWISSRRPSLPAPPAGRCALDRPVNRRWTLQISRQGRFDDQARALLEWAAKELGSELSSELAFELPPRRRPSRRLPPAGGGGSSSPAELGIPVGWVRRIP
jgi:hypothetical protein